MRVNTALPLPQQEPGWPEGFPQGAAVICTECSNEMTIDSPRDFTVRHHPPNPEHPDYTPPKRVPETGAYVSADASGTVPFDPEGERFVIEYTCPVCGTIQRAEV